MGIQGLVTYVVKKCPQVVRKISLNRLAGMTLACDAMHYIYKYKSVSNYMVSKTSYSRHYLESFIPLLTTLRKYHIDILFVFDGKPPEEKEKTRLKRRSQRDKTAKKVELYTQAINELRSPNPNLPEVMQILSQLEGKEITNPLDIDPISKLEEKRHAQSRQIIQVEKEDILNLKTLLKNLGIPYITAEGEGEKLCAHLAIHEEVNACLTTDSDVLAYGCPFYIRKIEGSECEEIELEDVISTLGFKSQSQFLDFCIMCGTDYNDNIPGIGPTRAHKLLLKYGSLEEVERAELGNKCQVLNYNRVRELFSNSHKRITPERISKKPGNRYAFMKHMRSLGIRVSMDTLDSLGL